MLCQVAERKPVPLMIHIAGLEIISGKTKPGRVTSMCHQNKQGTVNLVPAPKKCAVMVIIFFFFRKPEIRGSTFVQIYFFHVPLDAGKIMLQDG